MKVWHLIAGILAVYQFVPWQRARLALIGLLLLAAFLGI